jgi:ATP-binding cassette subfamily F protein 3
MLDDLTMVAPRSQTELRSLLGSFLFSEDDVFKKIGVLSGGERNRYALARMLLHPSNFLLLDEPTNHLDLRAKDVLLESLQKFSGTCVFVSHDRYFIDRLATRVFEVADGTVNIFPGNYEDYLWRKQNGAQLMEESLRASVGMKPGAAGAAVAEPVVEAVAEPKKRVNPMKRKQMTERLAKVETEVSETETVIAESEQSLSNYVSPEETQRVSTLLEEKRRSLEALEMEWAELSEALEEMD